MVDGIANDSLNKFIMEYSGIAVLAMAIMILIAKHFYSQTEKLKHILDKRDQEDQLEKINVLERLVHHQSETMADAVEQMRKLNADTHSRITSLSEEFHQFKGQCMQRAQLCPGNLRSDIPGRRRYDHFDDSQQIMDFRED